VDSLLLFQAIVASPDNEYSGGVRSDESEIRDYQVNRRSRCVFVPFGMSSATAPSEIPMSDNYRQSI